MQEDIFADLGENYEYIRTIVSNKIELHKLEMTERIGEISGKIIGGLILVLLSLIALTGILVALSIWLGGQLGSLAAGFGIVFAGISTVSFGLFLWRRTALFRPISNMLISYFMNTSVK